MSKYNSKVNSDNIKCPACGIVQKPHYVIHNWSYRKCYVTRFECICGIDFNFYKSAKSNWTIPKKITKERNLFS